MIFPSWVDGGRKSKAHRATARLRHIINTLASQHTERASLRALGEKVGVNYSTMSHYIARGHFSPKAANKIEAVLGECIAPATWFTNPLSIK